MRMNRYILSLLIWTGILFSVPSIAQVLIAEHHVPIVTDSLEVYKLPYIHITDSGRNCTWDYSNLSVDSAEIIDVDYFASGIAHIGLHREHANLYYYFSQDTLWQTGYETSHAHVQYLSPMPVLKFPFEYGDSLGGAAAGKGQYCHIVPISMDGTYSVYADAAGRLILPEMTLDSVLRIHSVFQYQDSKRRTVVKEERHIWYSPYCRYPLLESIIESSVKEQDTTIVTCAYYYPPEPTNLEHIHQMREIQEGIIIDPIDSLITEVQYLPNPVFTTLEVSYHLAHAAQVYISVHYNGGVTTYQTPILLEDEGFHSILIDMSGMPVGTYVVYIHADDMVISGNVIKL